MSKRGNPIQIKQEPHEEMLSEMHDALYSLGEKARKPYPRSGSKLLPKNLREQEPDGSKEARKHIKTLHKAMMEER